MDSAQHGLKSHILDAGGLNEACRKLVDFLLAEDLSNSGIVGIRTRGEHLAVRLQKAVEQAKNITLPIGYLDVSFYRDDTRAKLHQPVVQSTHIPFDINDKTIILVDDVLYTGRSVRAALDELMDFGRPARVLLMVLIDRGHRELPIQPDAAGMIVETRSDEQVRVKLTEVDGKDEVLLMSKSDD